MIACRLDCILTGPEIVTRSAAKHDRSLELGRALGMPFTAVVLTFPETLPRTQAIRLDGVVRKPPGEAGGDNGSVEKMYQRARDANAALAALGAALAGGPAWLTADVFLAWLMADATPKALGRDPALPTEKPISAAMAAAVRRLADWQEMDAGSRGRRSAEMARSAAAALAGPLPRLQATRKAYGAKAEAVRSQRIREAVADADRVRTLEQERQQAVTADERRAWVPPDLTAARKVGETRIDKEAREKALRDDAARLFTVGWMSKHGGEIDKAAPLFARKRAL